MEMSLKEEGKLVKISRMEERRKKVSADLAFQLWLPIIPHLICCHNKTRLKTSHLIYLHTFLSAVQLLQDNINSLTVCGMHINHTYI